MGSRVKLSKRADGTISVGDAAPQWAILALAALPALPGLWGLHAAAEVPRWVLLGAALLVGLAALMTGSWAVGTVQEAEQRGLITEVWRVEIRRFEVAGHYRDLPARPTLKAAGRTWPLEALRRIDLGEAEKRLELYLVLDDEVLRLVAPGGAGSNLADTAKELSDALGVPLVRQAIRDWESTTWGPALLVFVPLLTSSGGAWLAWDLAAGSPRTLPAVAVGLATVLFPIAWRFVIAKTTRRIVLPAGRAYVRERFGIEPRV